MNTWEVEHAHRIGKEVQRLRKAAGLTAQQLGDKAEQLGLKMTRQAISDLENGRRRYVTTAELLVLAGALNTSPVALLYSGPYQREVEVLPGVYETEFEAAQWISGLRYWGTVESDEPEAVKTEAGSEWIKNTRMLRLTRELEAAEMTRDLLVQHVKSDADRQQVAFYDSQIQWLRNELGRVNYE